MCAWRHELVMHAHMSKCVRYINYDVINVLSRCSVTYFEIKRVFRWDKVMTFGEDMTPHADMSFDENSTFRGDMTSHWVDMTLTKRWHGSCSCKMIIAPGPQPEVGRPLVPGPHHQYFEPHNQTLGPISIVGPTTNTYSWFLGFKKLMFLYLFTERLDMYIWLPFWNVSRTKSSKIMTWIHYEFLCIADLSEWHFLYWAPLPNYVPHH